MLTAFHLIQVLVRLVIYNLPNKRMTMKNFETIIEDVEACDTFWRKYDLI